MIKGTKQDFIFAIKDMSAIKGVKGINEQYAEWWIHPINANIVHLIKIIDGK